MTLLKTQSKAEAQTNFSPKPLDRADIPPNKRSDTSDLYRNFSLFITQWAYQSMTILSTRPGPGGFELCYRTGPSTPRRPTPYVKV